MSALVWAVAIPLWLFLIWLVLGVLEIGAEADRQTEIAFQAMLREQESRSQHASGFLSGEEGPDGGKNKAETAIHGG